MSNSLFYAYDFYDGELCLNTGVTSFPLAKVVGNYEKPTYIYNVDDVVQRVQLLSKAFSGKIKIHYAMKANGHPELLKTLSQMGLGCDIVSGGELKHALECGFSASSIVFSGVGKSKSEIHLALEKGVEQINIESPEELKRVAEIAAEMKVVARVAFRLNPDVDPKTHPYIKTGFRENKFGMDESFFNELTEILMQHKNSVELVGLTMHIGSQLRELGSTFEAVEKTLKVWDMFLRKGFPLKTLDIGGGVGIDYQSMDPGSEAEMILAYGERVLDLVGDRPLQLQCEPGRILVGRCGVLVTEVQYIKSTPYKNFCIVDTGMHHLLRPSLYQAYHRILPLISDTRAAEKLYDVVGPICESSDVVGHDRVLKSPKSGDLLAVMDAGAYGASMSSAYNMHAFPKEIVVRDGQLIE